MHPHRVLVIGGYGFFGRRLVERLARQPGLHVIVAGRSAAQGQTLVQTLRRSAVSELSCATLDIHTPELERALQALAPDVVVHTCGPFQGQQYHVAEACIAAGAHYIDLADGREFVAGIGCLQKQALAAGLAVISGASSVPALSSTVADHLAQGFTRVETIDIGISPGNRTDRGLSTIQAILSYCGKPLPVNGPAPAFGWIGSRRHVYPAPVGRRLLSPCDVPDRRRKRASTQRRASAPASDAAAAAATTRPAVGRRRRLAHQRVLAARRCRCYLRRRRRRRRRRCRRFAGRAGGQFSVAE
jgi:hypothetical protein